MDSGEEYEDYDSEEDEVLHALDWADLREDLQQRGLGAVSTSGWAGHHPNAQGGVAAARHQARALQPRINEMQRLEKRVSMGMLNNRADDISDHLGGHHNMDASVLTAVKVNAHREQSAGARGKDKSDRASVEQVLDPRTRMVLFKMLNSGVFQEINGCISTGKEANVYHASNADGQDLAVKVYKTSILVFKDRDRYVSGDFRFRNGYCKSNPRKMVKMWAEKEMRNLARMHAAGVRCPRPLQLRMHVLLMDFVGAEGVAAPRLKDAHVPLARLQTMYTEMVLLVRKLYQECHLVHADLSEYNILVHQGELWIIDVSQSVDLDHPRALDFLREDAAHVNAFFRRAGIATLTTRELFDFTVDPSINAGNIDAALEQLKQVAASRPVQREEDESVDDRVFNQAYIPRKLEEVTDYEKDYERLTGGGNTEGIYYQGITGMKADMTGARTQPAIVEKAKRRTSNADATCGKIEAAERGRDAAEAPHSSEHAHRSGAHGPGDRQAGDEASSESEDATDSASSSASDDEDHREEGHPRDNLTDLEALKAERKAHKKAVKEANREKRKTKLPKHVKKKHAKSGNKKKK
ncbi:hypothetical protein WJX72_006140 [[Myrmecia] bisecta]|uniref:Serine/threonine-protein kinase RIO1 n=1 Tax=[Myrmecia] bisecta TaxID=41462 RepID=A0AAW1QF95_9CHLO